MKRVAFLGLGLPPRGTTCKACGNSIAPGAQAFAQASYNNWGVHLWCSQRCFAHDHPEDPTATAAAEPAAPIVEPAPAADDRSDVW